MPTPTPARPTLAPLRFASLCGRSPPRTIGSYPSRRQPRPQPQPQFCRREMLMDGAAAERARGTSGAWCSEARRSGSGRLGAGSYGLGTGVGTGLRAVIDNDWTSDWMLGLGCVRQRLRRRRRTRRVDVVLVSGSEQAVCGLVFCVSAYMFLSDSYLPYASTCVGSGPGSGSML